MGGQVIGTFIYDLKDMDVRIRMLPRPSQITSESQYKSFPIPCSTVYFVNGLLFELLNFISAFLFDLLTFVTDFLFELFNGLFCQHFLQFSFG